MYKDFVLIVENKPKKHKLFEVFAVDQDSQLENITFEVCREMGLKRLDNGKGKLPNSGYTPLEYIKQCKLLLNLSGNITYF